MIDGDEDNGVIDHVYMFASQQGSIEEFCTIAEDLLHDSRDKEIKAALAEQLHYYRKLSDALGRTMILLINKRKFFISHEEGK